MVKPTRFDKKTKFDIIVVMDKQRVQIYKNLHNGMWSIRCTRSKLVIAHASYVVLSDVTFKVSEAGRQRVIREGKKNVHAFAEGILENWAGHPYKDRIAQTPQLTCAISYTSFDGERFKVGYNPYRFPYFYVVETLDKLINVSYAQFSVNGVSAINTNNV